MVHRLRLLLPALPLMQWSTAPDHSCLHMQMHGQMHVHGGWSPDYCFDGCEARIVPSPRSVSGRDAQRAVRVPERLRPVRR
ncbi:hypothetical protein FGF04_17475 [Streptomyces apricus]|uniref:Uncharacterized protein n=1 Tax=Streptomyces apricus TaxID=1828112 RepID=A0A5B0B0U1_9ACTN|nr:hypothetical protein FGF04_17475 [Streptomyces apricus]